MWRSITQTIALSISNSKGPQTIIIDGPAGCGKTATLLQLADFLNTWESRGNTLLFVFPRISRWTAGYYPYTGPNGDMYDQVELAKEILEITQKFNPNSVLIKGLVEKSKSAGANAIKCLEELFEEAPSGSFILADEVNALWAPTSYRGTNSKPLLVGSLSIVSAAKSFLCSGKHKLIGANCNSNPALVDHTLGKTTLAEAQWISAPYYSADEIRHLLNYYKSLGQIFKDTISDNFVEKMRLVSGGCGKKLLPAIQYDLVYKRK